MPIAKNGTTATFYSSGPSAGLWKTSSSDSSIVPTALTINSSTVSPSWYYVGNGYDNSSDIWYPQGGGIALASAGTGDDPAQDTTSASGTRYKGVRYNGGKYNQSTSDDFDIGTGDFVIEVFCRVDNVTSTPGILGQFDGTDGYNLLCVDTLNTVRMNVGTTAVGATTWDVSSCNADDWVHLMWFVNRDEASSNGGKSYRNGVANNSKDLSAYDGAGITSTGNFIVGTRSNGVGDVYDRPIVAIGLWELDDWFASGTGSHAEWLAIAARRASMFGV